MPKSAKTGREKKLTRETQSAERKRVKTSLKSYEASQKQLRSIGRGEGLPESDPSKILETMKSTQSMAEKYFEPHKQEALANFAQYQAPEIRNQYGANSGSRSSALNQALSAAAGNLHRQLNSDYQNLSMGLGQNLVDRQTNAQQFGLNSRMQALQSGLDPQSGFAAQTALQPQYLSKAAPSGTGKRIVGGAIQGAIAGAPAGPWGVAGGALTGAIGGWAGGGSGGGGGGGGLLSQFMPQGGGGMDTSKIGMNPRLQWSQ